MVTKSGELKTYYQINYENAFPKLSSWKTATHIAGLSLPFIGLLYKPAGKAISLTSNVLSTGAELQKAKKWTRAQALFVLKNGAEFVGTIASLRIGLAIHTVTNLRENLYELQNYKTLSYSDIGEKMLPVVSNALYLLTLIQFSNPVSYGLIGASLVFQAGWSLYKARQASQEVKSESHIKILDAVAHTALSVIFLVKARNCYQQWKKISEAVERTFVLMHPDKQGKDKNLTEVKNCFTLERIAKKNGKNTLVFFTDAEHLQTAQGLADHSKNPVHVVEKLHETNRFAKSPRYIIHRTLMDEPPRYEVETPAQVAARMDGEINNILAQQQEGPALPVILTGENAVKRYLLEQIRENPSIIENEAFTRGNMRIVTMSPDENGDLHVSHVAADDPWKIG